MRFGFTHLFIGLIMVREAQEPDHRGFLNLVDQHKGAEVYAAGAVQHIAQRLVVVRVLQDLGDLASEGITQTAVLARQFVDLILAFRPDLERVRDRITRAAA